MIVLSKSMPMRSRSAAFRSFFKSFLLETDHEEIVRHGRKAGVHLLVIHRKKKHVLKIALKKYPESLAALAIDVTLLARRRRIGLRFKGWRADDQHAVVRERFPQVAQVKVLPVARNVFDHIEAK